jgi:hypothetical protein
MSHRTAVKRDFLMKILSLMASVRLLSRDIVVSLLAITGLVRMELFILVE